MSSLLRFRGTIKVAKRAGIYGVRIKVTVKFGLVDN